MVDVQGIRVSMYSSRYPNAKYFKYFPHRSRLGMNPPHTKAVVVSWRHHYLLARGLPCLACVPFSSTACHHNLGRDNAPSPKYSVGEFALVMPWKTCHAETYTAVKGDPSSTSDPRPWVVKVKFSEW